MGSLCLACGRSACEWCTVFCVGSHCVWYVCTLCVWSLCVVCVFCMYAVCLLTVGDHCGWSLWVVTGHWVVTV